MNNNYKKTEKNIGMKGSVVVLAGALFTIAMLVTLALGGTFMQHASAQSAIAGKIVYLPWYGTAGKIVLLPPAGIGIGTITLLAPALVSPTFANV